MKERKPFTTLSTLPKWKLRLRERVDINCESMIRCLARKFQSFGQIWHIIRP